MIGAAPPEQRREAGAAAIGSHDQRHRACQRGPEKQVGAMARDSTEVAQAPAAWIHGGGQEIGQVQWQGHTSAAGKNTAKPIRPASGDHNAEIGRRQLAEREHRKEDVMADVTAHSFVQRSPPSAARERQQDVVASVPVAASPASTAICATVEETSGRGEASSRGSGRSWRGFGFIWKMMSII